MQQATRYTFWLLAAILLGAALIDALRQITGAESFHAVLPCVFALGGLGFSYFGFLFVAPAGSAACTNEDEGTAEEAHDEQAWRNRAV